MLKLTHMKTSETLIAKLKSKKARIAVIGLGYVGLPLAVEKAKMGFSVAGLDVNKVRVDMVNKGECYIPDVVDGALGELVKAGKLRATMDFSVLNNVDAICICVPTPLDENKDPDISYIKSTTKQVAKYLHKGQLVSLESTTYPGTTEEIMLPELEKTGLKVGKDFFLVFSPERVDPGNRQFNLKNTPKVIGGVTKTCSEVAKHLYGQIIDNIMIVSSPKVAEMEKLLENIYRSVNIALVNELAMLSKKMGIDMWEVVDAAATKPYGFMAFYPGPGIGGHCIPLDPIYLSWKAKKYDFRTEFIELAAKINENMPEYVIRLTVDALNKQGKSIKAAKVVLLGMAYKKDINDWRESPSFKLFEILKSFKAKVVYHDPFIPAVKIAGKMEKSVKLTDALIKSADCLLIATNHTCFDYKKMIKTAKLIVDTRGATRKFGKFKNVEVL
ncbi:MAG: UDP-N-acetyl-D-glucosamine dehydrogenase [Candidatus Firestonebacteria bacterium RIFOXYC2_FULL_39_67]|nr:MAG: UDP-N-acetyl-D-glucosamine dehydrogenase [Candidatus Firestonebacteria bacterium RIFOXYD2_FULL_39_29]OGF53734.1 MAG: UDP-N-acetyl-D-glucosamine dehydrogenase [Candidatus Firestonebacteria bacterium RifOxyC12_full_39_7]OGF54984.1 MAG: UDP-N-acetyl-D-glucosamine dehydrogenase [Candidatus Firestonebacteria bacterium RIFOXYC2_FULL_39_67]